ncbi:Retrotransposon gag domain [Arabidopsis suecica]|uniref:Retrotransposon gag domain n=1 Tax=Arabidopsis suecica TaxID=45249 RepID=A0A8T1ZV03_ARASU|nr:Retrotransposon gag domain [Arabidopsis suecica]
MAETRSMLLNEAVVRETEEVLGRLEQAIAERNQQFDKRMAELRKAIQLFSDQVNHSSSCGHLQQKQPRLEPDHERKQWIENFDRRRKSHEVIDSNSQEKESSVDNIVTQSKVILQHSSAPSAAFSHFQVPKYHLEPSLGCCNEPLNVFETWPSEIVRNIGVQSQSGLECVMSKNNAHQVFDRLLLRRHKFQQRRKLSLSPKSWMFKFKNMTLSRNRSQRDLHQVFDISNINNPYPCSSVNVGLVRKKRTFQRLRLTKQAHMSRVLNNMRMLHDPGGIKQLLIVDMQPEFLCKMESGEVTVITPEESKTRRLLLPISDAQFMLQEDLLVVFQDIFTVQPPFSCTDSLLHEKIPVSSLIVEEAITSFQSLTVISRELQAALQGREWGADSIIPDVVSKAVVWTSSTQNKQRKFLKTWKFKYKNVKEGIQKLQIQSRYQNLQRLDVLKMNEVGFTRDRELPIAFKDRRKGDNSFLDKVLIQQLEWGDCAENLIQDVLQPTACPKPDLIHAKKMVPKADSILDSTCVHQVHWQHQTGYAYSIRKQNGKWKKLLCSRRLVIYKLRERKLEVIQSQTFDPGIGLESQEILRSLFQAELLQWFSSNGFMTLRRKPPRISLHHWYQSHSSSESMAETRSQALLKEALVRATIDGEIEKKIDEVFTAIYVKVDTGSPISFQNQNRATPEASATPEALYPSPKVMRCLRSSMHSNYSSVTRLAKLGFPRFNGDKIKEWLFKVEQFFEIDQIPDELKIGFASIHFDDLAITWHQSIAQSGLWKHIMHDWETYKLLLLGKYSKHVDDSIAQLKQLQETEGIEEYHARFGLINTIVDIDEDYLVSVYLAGLRTDTRENVQVFQPQTVNQCFLVGRLYEQAHPLKRDSEMKAEEEKKVAEIEVKTEVETKLTANLVQEAFLEDESTPQVQVPIAKSEILKSIEPREVNLGLENLESVVMNENLEHDGVQKNVTKRFEVDGNVEKTQKVLSVTEICCAHQKTRPQIEDVLEEEVYETFDQYIRESGLASDDRGTENNQPTLMFSMWVIQTRLNPYMVVLVKLVAYATHFLVGVGMDKKQCRLSLRTNRVWDPGGLIFLGSSNG